MSGSIRIRGAALFDGEKWSGDRTVLVSGSGVAEVDGSSSADVEVDGRGKALIPGFIDAHVHIGFHDPSEVVSGGVTAARDLGWPVERIFPLAKELQGEGAPGPYLLAAGAMITARGGYPVTAEWAPPGTGLEIDSADEAITAVGSMFSMGASVIKVAQEPRAGPCLAPELLGAVVDEAHRLGLRVTSHVGSLAQLETGIEAGIDELAHGLWSNEEIAAEVVERMVDAGITVIPTLHIDPSPQRIENLRRFLEAGGKVVYGTDMGNTGPPPGIDSSEIALMMESGMTLDGALASATSAAADYLNLAGRGRVEPGAVADLVLVTGDPRDELRLLEEPELVFREGKRAGGPV